jgi:hypothetical protein
MIDAVIADLPVLAIDALQVAVCEEDIADALLPAYGWLFPAMDAYAADAETGSAPAPSGGSDEAVDMAFPRT